MSSIRSRLLSMLLPGLALVLLVGGFAVHWIARADLMRQLDKGLLVQAHALAAHVSYGEEGLEFEFDQEPSVLPEGVMFEFRSGGGEVLRRSDNLYDAPLLSHTTPSHDQPVFDDASAPWVVSEVRLVALAFQPRVDEDAHEAHRENPETLILAAAVDRAPVDRALGTLLAALIIVGLAAGAIVGGLVVAGVRRGLAPLDRLSRQLGAAGGATIAARFHDGGAPRELLPVYRELNGLLERVGQTIERERAFADAAAHELRTPLAELRATAEVALRFPDARAAADSLREALDIGREMERLVESLLLISRANAGEIEHAAALVPIAPFVNRCLERARPTINDKRLQITADVDPGHVMTAPPAALEIIIRNLIDNAVHHTPPGGTVSVSCERTDAGSTALVVENGPVNLSAGDVARLFEPFWRLDQARTDREHVGLGLTVVHRLAHAIGLRVEAALNGDRLTMRLSAAM